MKDLERIKYSVSMLNKISRNSSKNNTKQLFSLLNKINLLFLYFEVAIWTGKKEKYATFGNVCYLIIFWDKAELSIFISIMLVI